MARIPYAENNDDPEFVALRDRIVKERGGRLLNLYKMLLNSPPVAAGWLNLLTAIRQQASLSGKVRELAILRIALINGAPYEHAAHVPFALKEGASQAEIDALDNWETAGIYEPRDRAVLAYTDAMTKTIQVPDPVFAEVSRFFNPREMTELTATIAAYNLVSRFLVALQVDHEEEPHRAD